MILTKGKFLICFFHIKGIEMEISKFLNSLLDRASKDKKTIVLPEGEDERILQAAHVISERKAANIIILGNEEEIKAYFAKNNWNMDDISIIKPATSTKLEEYANLLYELRKAKGMTLEDARKMALNYNYFGTLMIKAGDADGMVSGAIHATADVMRPALQIIKTKPGIKTASTFFVMCCDKKLMEEIAQKASDSDKLFVEEVESDWYITCKHSMIKDHYISFVAFATGSKLQIVKQYPEWDLQVRFQKREHGTLFWYCTNHGLFYQHL